MNRWEGIGRIVRDAEITFLKGSGQAKCNFTLAINKKYNDKEYTSFIPCTLWGERAEKLCEYLEQGKLMFISGALNINSVYDEELDVYKNYTNIDVIELEFLSSNNAGANESNKGKGKAKGKGRGKK